MSQKNLGNFVFCITWQNKGRFVGRILGEKRAAFSPAFKAKSTFQKPGDKNGQHFPCFQQNFQNCLQKTLGNLGSISPVFIKTFPKIELSEKILGQILAEDHPGDKTHIQKIDLSEKLLRKNGQQLPVFIQSCFCLDLMLKIFCSWIFGEEFGGRNFGGELRKNL